MVVLIIKIHNFNIFFIHSKCEPPVFCNKQAPNTLFIACKDMGFPAYNRSQLIFAVHVLENEIIFLSLSVTAGESPDVSSNSTKRFKALFDVPDFHNRPNLIVDPVSNI